MTITAEQARKLTQTPSINREEVYSAIEKEASCGGNSIAIAFYGNSPIVTGLLFDLNIKGSMTTALRNDLEENGFRISQPSPANWPNRWVISW